LPLDEQTIVITGASSGIGLATAELAAERGARLVLVARNEGALDELTARIRERGGDAIAVKADVARGEDLERVAAAALGAYGGIDTWVNNAGVSVYGTLDEIPVADHRRVFDVNYWGVVNGSLAAIRAMREEGGALINIGSVLSDMPVVLQGPYCATKYAVKAFTDTLRMELEHEGAPISVTLIKPSAVDTPFFEHARNLLDSAGIRNPPPAYDPKLVARAILFAAEHPRRTLIVGFGGYASSLLRNLFPALADRVTATFGVEGQQLQEEGEPGRRDNLYAPREDGGPTSSYPGGSRGVSLFLEAQMRPVATTALLGGAAIGVALLARWASGRTGAAEEHRALQRREELARGILE
jgi:short-subunit dehydrogenase